MKIIFIIILLSISGCATRTSVYFNKKTSDHWIKVESSKEFMKEDELKFFNEQSIK